MATREILMTVQHALFGSSNYPQFKRHASSGTETPEGWIISFDDTADEHCYFLFRVPDNYSSGPTLIIQYSMASATSNAVRWVVNVMCATEDADDLDTADADSDNASNDTVPNAAGEMGECTISLTNNDSMAAGDLCILKVGRDGSNGGDTATGDAELWLVAFKYTTT